MIDLLPNNIYNFTIMLGKGGLLASLEAFWKMNMKGCKIYPFFTRKRF